MDFIWFGGILKLCLGPKISKEPFNKNEDFNGEMFDTFTDSPTLCTDRTRIDSHRSSVYEEHALTDLEKERKIKDLNQIFWTDDINIMSFDDVIEPDFIQNLLCFMKPTEFHKDVKQRQDNPFVHILFQIKNFLHWRNFDAVKYLKNIRNQIESPHCDDEAKWEIVRLTLLVAFLLKDEDNGTFGPKSLIQTGFDFTNRDKNTLKPSFIKSLFVTLAPVLSELDHFDDESIVDSTMGKCTTSSFVVSNPEIVEMRKTGQVDEFMETMQSTYDAREEVQEEDYESPFSPFKSPEPQPGEFSYLYIIIDEFEQEDEFSDIDDETNQFLQTRRTVWNYESSVPRLSVSNTLSRTFKFNSRKLSTPHSTQYRTPKASFSEQVLEKITDEFESREKEYTDKIQDLQQALSEIEEKNEELQDQQQYRDSCIRDLEHQIRKLQFAERALESLNLQIYDKKEKNEELVLQVYGLIERLTESEQTIKKFMATLKTQDEIHEQHLNFFRQSENLLKGYYEEKLQYCLHQLELRKEAEKSDFSCQASDPYEKELEQKLEAQDQEHSLKLRKSYLYLC